MITKFSEQSQAGQTMISWARSVRARVDAARLACNSPWSRSRFRELKYS
ncbi:hypothetical protein ACFFX0_31125 [Citricoccus parietis]|uniref:Uncharacterized protein n=1 Tax=Citricoccus parietis TaxID=592307 RepID=A0ABV5G8V7_9MICC